MKDRKGTFIFANEEPIHLLYAVAIFAWHDADEPLIYSSLFKGQTLCFHELLNCTKPQCVTKN